MKIVSFKSQDLHGYLSFSLRLRPDLTILTGINGSGKTSAVRAITSLLTPSFQALANMAYTSLSVTVEIDGKEISITSQRNEDEIMLMCSTITNVDPLHIPVLKPDAYESHTRFMERQRDFYREQQALKSQQAILNAIEKLPTPMFLDLERRHQEGTRARREPVRFSARALPVNPLAGSLVESLTEAQGLAESSYRRFLAGRAQFTDSLKQELILSAFRQIKTDDQMNLWNERPQFLTNIHRSERLVLESLTQIGMSTAEVGKVVRDFFERVKTVASQLPPEEDFSRGNLSIEQFAIFQEWSALQPQVQQINAMASRIVRYNRDIAGIFSEFDRYLTSVNSFLSDSKKRMGFDESGNLKVFVDSEIDGRTISSLSSGERQLVVILTHLAFNRQAKQANVLIIDEPELSLHLRWQELFVDAVTSASPDLQLILATHSPSIIKGRITNCIDIEEARQDDRLLP